MTFHFDLIHQPWIPVVDLDGMPREVSLRDALVYAQNYRELAASLPHTNAALYRLLLAVLHRNFGPAGEDEWQRLWKAQQFEPQKLEAYFEQYADRFDLFSAERPFMQNRHPLMAVKPANALLFLVAGGDADTLFDHSIDDRPVTLTPAQAALALVTAHSFGLAGLCHPQLKLVYTDAPCSRAAVFFLQGKNLFESLMLNLVQYTHSEPIPWHGEVSDQPAWELADPYLPERTIPFGYLDYLTWQNRRIMLLPSEVDGQTVVREVVVCSGLTLDAGQRNPMYHYRIDPKEGRKMLRFSEGRALWRDSSVLLNFRDKATATPQALQWVGQLILDRVLPDEKLRLSAYGMCTEPGKQKVHFYRGEQFEFSDALLKDETLVAHLDEALDKAEEVRRQLWGALRTLATLLLEPDSDLADSNRKPAPKDLDNLLTHWNAEGQYWNLLEIPFYHFLDQLPGNTADAVNVWLHDLRKAARAAFEQVVEISGTNSRALKASAKGRVQLLAGLKKALEPQTGQE
jgi:CRISPR system Cascade subunit CasA